MVSQSTSSFETLADIYIACVFLTFIITAAIVWWLIAGRKYFTGPLIEAELQSLSSGESDALQYSEQHDSEKKKIADKVVDEELRHQRAI